MGKKKKYPSRVIFIIMKCIEVLNIFSHTSVQTCQQGFAKKEGFSDFLAEKGRSHPVQTKTSISVANILN